MYEFEDDNLDVKQTNVIYPHVNNESVLEFVFAPHPNLFLRKNKIAIRGTLELDSKYVPDNGIASKASVFLMFSYIFSLVIFYAYCSSSESNCQCK